MKPRFIHWEPHSGWLAAEHDHASYEVRANVSMPVNSDRRVVVEVERSPPHRATESSVVAAKNEGRYFSAQIPTGESLLQARYRWRVESVSQADRDGVPAVYARSEWRALMTLPEATHPQPQFQVLSPADGATDVGESIAGDPDFVHAHFRFDQTRGPWSLVEFWLRVRDANDQVQWFDDVWNGSHQNTATLPRGKTFRVATYGLYIWERPGLGMYRIYVRGPERTITTKR